MSSIHPSLCPSEHSSNSRRSLGDLLPLEVTGSVFSGEPLSRGRVTTRVTVQKRPLFFRFASAIGWDTKFNRNLLKVGHTPFDDGKIHHTGKMCISSSHSLNRTVSCCVQEAVDLSQFQFSDPLTPCIHDPPVTRSFDSFLDDDGKTSQLFFFFFLVTHALTIIPQPSVDVFFFVFVFILPLSVSVSGVGIRIHHEPKEWGPISVKVQNQVADLDGQWTSAGEKNFLLHRADYYVGLRVAKSVYLP